MLNLENHVRPLIEREVNCILREYPEHSETVNMLVTQFTARFRDNLITFNDAFGLCSRVQEMLDEYDIPDEILGAINASRRKILFEIIQHGLEHNTLEGDTHIQFELQFPTSETRGNGRRRSSKRERTEHEYEEIVRAQNFDIIRLAAELGEDAAADVLCALGQIGTGERSRVTSFISAYLGKSASPEPFDPGELLTYPRAVLDVPAVRTVAWRLLLQECYRFLLESGIDDYEKHKKIRRNISSLSLKHMEDLSKSAGVTDSNIHAGLFVEMSDFLNRACTQPHPKALVSTLHEQGEDRPFPSFRQLIAIQRLKELRRLYVGFEPGLGKTPIPFHLMQELREAGKKPRMLCLGPLAVIQEIPNRIRPGSAPKPTRDCYYSNPEEDAPTLEIVASSLSNDEIITAVTSPEITFCPYSMLHSSRNLNGSPDEDEKVDEEVSRLIDLLCEQDWDILVIDEAHEVDGNKVWTRLVDRLIHGEDGLGTHLSKKGHVVALSGSPVMNTIADPVVIHDLFKPPAERERLYGSDLRETSGRDMATERGLNPAQVRQALNETLLILDLPEEWLHNVNMLDYEPTERELTFIRAICSNPTLSVAHKLQACNQFLLCPKLVSGDETMPESLLEWVTMQLDADLRERNAILIAENMRAEGVLRAASGDHAPEPNEMELHFYMKIEQYCQQWSEENNIPVNYYTVHGKASPQERQDAYADATDAQSNGNHKTVIFAMTRCLNTGIRLHLDRILSLEWPYNSPVLQQLLKRALREGNEDVNLTACYAQGTVQQGVYEQAMDKYRDALQALYGTGVSDAMLRAHLREREQVTTPESDTELLRLLLHSSPTQRCYEIERWLHSRGANGITQLWDRHKELFNQLYAEADEMGTGDMQRFLCGLINNMSQQPTTVLDVNSGGLTLERELRRLQQGSNVQLTSTDPHSFMLERGRAEILEDNPDKQCSPTSLVSRPEEVNSRFNNGEMGASQYDIGILRNLEQCNYTQAENVLHERARALNSLVRTVKTGGRIVIPLSRTTCTKEEFEYFVTETLPLFGCTAIDGWHGSMRSLDNEGDVPFRGFCVVAEKREETDDATLRELLGDNHLQFSHHSSWATTAEGTRITNAMRRPRLPYPIRHAEFQLGNRKFEAVQSDAHSEQAEHLKALTDAVQIIHKRAPTISEWKELAPQQRAGFTRQGILCSNDLSRSLNRPTYSLSDYPGHLFFPYDPQWKSV